MSFLCKNRVVIITGAGGGLGRAYALAFGAAGAMVIVNDIDPDTAQKTVDDIKAAGGIGQVNVSDITDYEASLKTVNQALETFGDLHVVVNNAGLCRDRMFVNLSSAEWDAVMAVHLKGHFCIANHACRYWREQAKQGKSLQARIINTTSGAGLQGSIGQSNYSAAKGGILALTLVQAAELHRYGITANALAPVARTAMTEGPFAEVMKPPSDGSFDYYNPDNVAPLVVWLGSEESAEVTGHVFEVEGGKITIATGWRAGPTLDKGERWRPGELGPAVKELLHKAVPPQKVYGT